MEATQMTEVTGTEAQQQPESKRKQSFYAIVECMDHSVNGNRTVILAAKNRTELRKRLHETPYIEAVKAIFRGRIVKFEQKTNVDFL